MTISTRNNLLLGLLILCGIILVFSVLGSFLFWNDFLNSESIQIPILSVFACSFSLIGGLLLRVYFRKSISIEIFFFTLFVFAFSFEAFRLGVFFVEIRNKPFHYGILFTRIVYFGRIFRLFCLFITGLFAVSTKSWKPWLFLGITALVSFTITAGIPINPTETLPLMTYETGNSIQLLAISLFFSFFTVVNLVLAGMLKNTREYYFIAGSAFLILAANGIFMYTAKPVFLFPAGAVLIGGSAAFSKAVHKMYMWS